MIHIGRILKFTAAVIFSMTCFQYISRAQDHARKIAENGLVDAVQMYENGRMADADALLEAICKRTPEIDGAWY